MQAKKNQTTFQIVTKEWIEKLNNCQYVSEVFLSNKKLETIAEQFASSCKNSSITRQEYETSVLVMAVNCAYHYYDDQGFWCHFCQLIKVNINSAETERLGIVIERKLKSLGLLKNERRGPFRYVGAILEQTGVSKKYITTFARIIRDIKHHNSWESLEDITYYDFQHEISKVYCSAYLKNFLLDVEGWKFTKQLFKILKLYEQGIMDITSLRELQGYQPDFWEEFLGEFSEMKNIYPEKVFVFQPRLVFMPEDRVVGLKFFSPQYLVEIIEPSGVNNWQFPITILDTPASWSEKYSGKIYGNNGKSSVWTSIGWKPNGTTAVFDFKQGFIKHGRNLSPGEYYLLTPDRHNVSCLFIKDMGQVNIPENNNYKSYLVQIRDGDFIPNYGTVDFKPPEVVIQWQDPECFRMDYVDSIFEVFNGTLPEIIISDFSPIKEGKVGLFYSTNQGSGRIATTEQLQKFSRTIGANGPVIGRVWLAEISRNDILNNDKNATELQFCVVPYLGFQYDQKLYSYNESVKIKIETKAEYIVTFNNSVIRENNEWNFAANLSKISGIISIEDITFGVFILINRACIYTEKGRPLRYVDISEFSKDSKSLLIKGLPLKVGTLCTSHEQSKHIEIIFDVNGIVRLDTDKLVELAIGTFPLIEINIFCDGKVSSTGTCLIKLKELREYVIHDKCYEFPKGVTDNILKVVDLCKKICRGYVNVDLARKLSFHPAFDDWVYTIFAFGIAIDNSKITIDGNVTDFINKTPSEVNKILVSYTNIFSGELISEAVDFKMENIPSINRWRNAVSETLAIKPEDRVKEIISEWSNELLSTQVQFRSRIYLQTGGIALNRAWSYYLIRDYGEAISVLTNLRKGTYLIGSIKQFLFTLLFMRMGRIESARDCTRHQFDFMTEPRSNGDLHFSAVIKTINYLTKMISGNGKIQAGTFLADIAQTLPLNPEDVAIITLIVNDDCQYQQSVIRNCDDWLALFVLFNIVTDEDYKKEIIKRVISLIKYIPRSPEQAGIMDQLNKSYGGTQYGS